MNPQEQRFKATAAMMLTVSLFLVRSAHAMHHAAGACTVTGTPGADAIEGTAGFGDVILAGGGSDEVHANDGHTDRVDCGPGHDIVWADRTDRLLHCEIVHR